MRYNKLIYIMTTVILFAGTLSCRKFVDVNPPVTTLNAENVYRTDATAAAALTGIYGTISASSFSDGGFMSLSLFPGLSADELKLTSGVTSTQYLQYYRNALNANTAGFEYWNSIYPIIYMSNSAIEGLNKSDKLTSSVKAQLLGEAKFIRAYCYFYLVNLYGDVPLITTTDYSVNAAVPRTAKSVVYQQIIADLKEAENSLSAQYLDASVSSPSAERIRPTKWAASAMLSRVYLYLEDWANAESRATAIISQVSLYDTVSLSQVFLKNSKEAIWQLQPVRTNQNTPEGQLFILPATGPAVPLNNVYMSSTLVRAFDPDDRRKSNWVGNVIVGADTFYFPSKYKVKSTSALTEYSMALRIAELYLIRSEARAKQNKISESQSDLNVIRKRAGLPNTTAADKDALSVAILQERRYELFTEWGHRWLDLKRTGQLDAVMTTEAALKGGSWSAYKKWYPLPVTELRTNPTLLQNEGY